MKKREETKHLVSSLFSVPLKWTYASLSHREMAVYFVVHFALNTRIIFKTQKAEGFWQSSSIISHPSILIALQYLSQCQGGGGRLGMGMDVQMAQWGAIGQTERKILGFCILYERLLYSGFGVLDGCHKTDSQSIMWSLLNPNISFTYTLSNMSKYHKLQRLEMWL